jgi:CheY-like chemotaxis protein
MVLMSKKPYVIVVDDDPDDVEMLAEMFEQRGLEVPVHSFVYGEEAVSFLASRDADDLPVMVITDYQLPKMNGAQLLGVLKQDRRYDGISKVVLSTSGNPAHAEECLGNGAEKYLVKPNELGQLDSIAEFLVDLFLRRSGVF